MRSSSWSPDRRRRCGNVEIARFGFWRDFQARWEAWKSPGAVLSLRLAVGRTFPRFPRRVISTAILPPPFASSAFGGMPPETAEVLVAGTRQPKIFFPKEVKS